MCQTPYKATYTDVALVDRGRRQLMHVLTGGWWGLTHKKKEEAEASPLLVAWVVTVPVHASIALVPDQYL